MKCRGLLYWIALSSVLCAAIFYAGCTSEGGGYLVGFSQCNNAEPWRQAMNAAAEAEAKNYPEIRLVFSDAQQDNAKQVADVENFLRQRVDLLIISPNEAEPLAGIIEKVHKSGIPVIVLDRETSTEEYDVFIGADNVEIGVAAGEYAVEVLGGEGSVVEIWGLPGSPPAVQRSEGFHRVVDKYSGIRVIHSPVANWLRDEAKSQMEMALQAHDKIDLVYAHNDPMAYGAWLAAKQVGREGEIKFIGIDALPGPDGGVKMVLDGKLSATFYYPTCGREAVQTAAKILKGESAPRKITLQTARITAENAEAWYKAGGPPE
jgi:ribose transport system substrate-binding protein